jgi:hypothetical protein
MRRLVVLVVAVLVLSACWEQRGFDAGNTGSSPLPTSVGADTVGSLTHVFTDAAPTGTTFHAVVSGGKLFAVGDRVEAFDAAGCSGPVPTACTPIWQSADLGGFGNDLVVGGGKVWVTREPGDSGETRGYDPTGAACPTSNTCAPVITITTPHAQPTDLRWIGNTLHVTDWVGAFGNAPAHHYHYAYEADGTLRWQVDLGTATSFYAPHPAVADGDTVFLGLPLGPSLAFDNRGITGCTGTPRTCTPMWSYSDDTGAQAARNGRLYASVNGAVAAFDAHGTQGCSGVPKVCAPLWSTPTGSGGATTVGSKYLYDRVPGGNIGAFAVDGTGCSGAPVVCQPQWTSVQGASGTASPVETSEAGGVLYTLSDICDDPSCTTTGNCYVDGHDAAGTEGCAGTPKICRSLFSKVLPFKPDEVIVVGDVVYVTGDGRNLFSDPAPPIWGFRTS